MEKKKEKKSHLFAYTAEGAGGGVLPEVLGWKPDSADPVVREDMGGREKKDAFVGVRRDTVDVEDQ